MDDGDIVEQGDHSQLLEKTGFYTNLYYSQFENGNYISQDNNIPLFNELLNSY